MRHSSPFDFIEESLEVRIRRKLGALSELIKAEVVALFNL
jgi:hypothetical protein